MALQLGQILDGKYRIVRIIGEGGMGAVYEGENSRIKRKVAIKLLHAGIAENEEMVQRFEREAQVAGTVGNDHILEILDLGALPSGERYMVMEFLEGETLTDRIKTRVRLTPKDAVMLVKQVLTGLAAAHGAGIVHRDLKPDNIFILRSKAGVKDYVKIIDFGISKFSEQGATSRMTRTGALMGTPHYMAPEQATGSAEIDRRTDIYAVGIILYEAVTGRVPFQAETFNQLLFEIALAKIIPARQVVPDLDPAIDSIIMKASARDPAHRFQTCEDFVAALDEWEKSGRSVSLPPEQSIEAIFAASVPRAASLPSSSDLTAAASATNGSSQSSFRAPTGSVAGVPAVTAAEPALRQPTVNTWANNSQADVLPPPGPPVMAATIAGVLLLVGGAIGAYFVLRPSPAPQPAANIAAVATAAASVPVVVATPAPKAEETAPSVVPSTAPAEVKPEKIDPVVPVAKAAAPLAVPKPQAKQAAARAVPQTQEKPKAAGSTRKAINFGY